jgi:hypothetical protein
MSRPALEVADIFRDHGARASIEAHGGTPLVIGDVKESMDGSQAANRIVVVEFPSTANGRLGDLYDCIGRSADGGHRPLLKRLLAGTLIDKRFHDRGGFGFLLWRLGDERCHNRPHIR